jgi:hypothetical protein
LCGKRRCQHTFRIGCSGLLVDLKKLVFDYLDSEDFARLNLGRSMADLRDAGYAGYPAFDVKRRDEGGFREHVMEAFLRRLPPATRPDFGAYWRISVSNRQPGFRALLCWRLPRLGDLATASHWSTRWTQTFNVLT